MTHRVPTFTFADLRHLSSQLRLKKDSSDVRRRPVAKGIRLCCFVLALLALAGLPSPLLPSHTHSPVAHAQGNCPSVTSGAYQTLRCLTAQGQQGASMVGPGATANSNYFYVTYLYEEQYGVGDVVVIDPNTGAIVKTFQLPTSPAQQGSYAMIPYGGDMYIGTLPNGHLVQYNPQTNSVHDFGQLPISPDGTPVSYIYGLTQSPYNGHLYACTYPDADLVQIIPSPDGSSVNMTNLGSLTSGLSGVKDAYAHYCVADPSASAPYIYAGIGTGDGRIMAYDLATGAITTLGTPITGDFPLGAVFLGTDGHTYGTESVDGKAPQPPYEYLLQNGTATQATPASAQPTNIIQYGTYAGYTINVDGSSDGNPNLCPGQICLTKSGSPSKDYAYSYAGEPLNVFRFGISGDGSTLTGGTIKPFYMVSCSTSGCPSGVSNQGYVAGGEPYSFLLDYSGSGDYYIADYYTPDLLVYNPSTGINVSKQTCNDTSYNPWCVQDNGVPSEVDLRPQAMIYGYGSDHTIYIGGGPLYGGYTGPFFTWTANPTNPSANVITEYGGNPKAPFIANESVVSLASSGICTAFISSGACIVGGTSILGEGVSGLPTGANAQLFVWNPTANQIVPNSLINIPLPSAQVQEGGIVTDITDLLVNPANNFLLYGIANVQVTVNGAKQTVSDLFTYNMKAGGFDGSTTPLNGIVQPQYNSIHALSGTDGTNYLWGLASNGVFYIDTHNFTYGIAMNANACPVGPALCSYCPNLAGQTITSGFAATAGNGSNGTVYFGTIGTTNGVISDSALWKYTIPPTFPTVSSLC